MDEFFERERERENTTYGFLCVICFYFPLYNFVLFCSGLLAYIVLMIIFFILAIIHNYFGFYFLIFSCFFDSCRLLQFLCICLFSFLFFSGSVFPNLPFFGAFFFLRC